MNRPRRPTARPVATVRSTIWFGLWLLALVVVPILIINKLILGHPMPDWVAGLISLTGWGVVMLLRPWIVRWHHLDRAPRRRSA